MKVPLLMPLSGPVSEMALKSVDSVLSELDMECVSDRILLYDPMITGESGGIDGLSSVNVDTSGHSPHSFTSRYSAMLSAFHELRGESRYAISIPCNWLLVQKMNISSAVRILASDDNVFSVSLGGNPCAHTDINSFFSLTKSPISGYVKIRSNSFDVPGLDRLECPAVVDLYHVSSAYHDKSGLSGLSRCGWDNKYMVIYPEKLTCGPRDGKPEPFRDMAGIAPEFWDKYEEN